MSERSAGLNVFAETSKPTGADAEVPQPDGDTVEWVHVDGGCPVDESAGAVDAPEMRS